MSLSRLSFVEFLIHHCSFSHNRTSDKGNNFKVKRRAAIWLPLKITDHREKNKQSNISKRADEEAPGLAPHQKL